MSKQLWTMKNGDNILLEDMSFEHVENSIKMLVEGRFSHAWTMEHGEKWFDIFTEELLKRGCLDTTTWEIYGSK